MDGDEDIPIHSIAESQHSDAPLGGFCRLRHLGPEGFPPVVRGQHVLSLPSLWMQGAVLYQFQYMHAICEPQRLGAGACLTLVVVQGRFQV